jgi:hypothetical protein
MQYTTWSKHRLEFRILGIVRQLRLFLSVEVIEVAEEFVEAVDRRQIFVAITEVILAELAGGIAERLERLGNRPSAIVGSSFCRPTFAPGIPTLVRPVRIGFWPAMKQARPAVQLCCE